MKNGQPHIFLAVSIASLEYNLHLLFSKFYLTIPEGICVQVFHYFAKKNVKFPSRILLNGRQPSIHTVLNLLDKQNSKNLWLAARLIF